MDKISIIVPCYNEEKTIPVFYEELEKTVKKDFKEKVKFEYIFVNDGSKDKTLEVLKDLASKDEKVKYISFSRNFFKEAAMLAGLKNATGDFITVMDADLQDPPSLLKEMYDTLKSDEYDIVATRRTTRKGEPKIRSFFAKKFYKIINKMSDVEMVDGARDYRLMKRKVVDSVLELKEYNRYSKGIFSFVGFKTKWLEYENIERVAGKTNISFKRLFKYAIEGITSFSVSPLIYAIFLGIIFLLVAFIMLIIILVNFIKHVAIGLALKLSFLILLTSGIELLILGIIGEYLSKMYLEIKNRPIYIIDETNIK